MPTVLKITYDDNTFRYLLEDRPSYDAVDVVVQRLAPGGSATFADAAGLPKQLSAASFEQFLATAGANAAGRQVLRLQLAHASTPTAAVAAIAPAPTELASAPTPQCSAAPAGGLVPPLHGKRIAIMPRGSRGDVQPFVALGSRLMAEGCKVLVLTNTDHVDFVAKFGMEAVGVAPDCRKDHEAPEFQHGLATGDWRAAAARWERQAAEELPPLLRQELAALRDFAPDLIYATPLAEMRAWLYSNMTEIPVLLGTLQPVDEGLTRKAEEMRCGMEWHSGQAELAVMKKVIQEDFKDLWFDPAWATFWSYRLWKLQPPHPVLVHWSPALNEAPARKQRTHRLTGFLVVEQPEQEERFRSLDSTFGGEALRELQAFLDAGERPVYMGWGSIALVSPEHMACLAVRALRSAGFRGIVLGGWAGLAAHMLEGQPDAEELLAYAREKVLFVQSAPHEWLFPRCVAAVHHGGAGTMAAALRAGLPTVITPMGLDQPGNAKRVQEAGCGLALQHFPKVTPEALAAALRRCVADGQMAARCAVMGEFLRAEDGVGNAAAEVERFLQEEVATGIWRARLEELRARARASAGPLGPMADPASWQELARAFGHGGRRSGGAFH